MNKRKIFFSKVLLIGLFFSFNTIEAEAPVWNIDDNHTSISFEVTHFFTPVAGSFKEFEGALNFDPENLAGSRADFIVQIASVETDNEKRNNHLQSADFFDVKKFPEMKFKSSSFTKEGDNYTIFGQLTIRDITREISIPVNLLGLGDHPLKKGKLITAMRAEFSINRNDYGVGSGSWTATAVVGDEVKIRILLEANRNK
jgi:polyisoprenoid-binding protein YceI